MAGSPAAAIRIRGVHGECAAGGSLVAVAAISKADHFAALFANEEMDAAGSFLRAVVVEARDKGINRQVREGRGADLAVDGDGLRITDRPIVRALVRIGDLLDGGPGVAIEGFADVGESQRIALIGGRCLLYTSDAADE